MLTRLTTAFFQTALVIIYNFLLITVPPNKNPHPDLNLTTIEIVKKYGYPFEQHTVQTEDGYILNMFRLPHGRNNSNSTQERPPMLIVHGLLLSASDWINVGPERGLAFLMADRGYDVWLTNARGTTWSPNHTKYTTDDPRYWDYSFHEIGIYDLPVSIDYVLEKTGTKSIYYIGHSQGATAFFIMNSLKPAYNEKIRFMAGYAPVAYSRDMTSTVFRTVSAFQPQLETLANTFGVYKLLPPSENFRKILRLGCSNGSQFQSLCETIFMVVSGFNYKQFVRETFPVILNNMPGGAALKQLFHYTQIMKTDIFQGYDHGPIRNYLRYGSIKPPLYDLSKVTSPVALFYSENDFLTSVYDMDRISRELPNVVAKTKVSDQNFNHWDFMWAKDVVPNLCNPLMDVMRNY